MLSSEPYLYLIVTMNYIVTINHNNASERALLISYCYNES